MRLDDLDARLAPITAPAAQRQALFALTTDYRRLAGLYRIAASQELSPDDRRKHLLPGIVATDGQAREAAAELRARSCVRSR